MIIVKQRDDATHIWYVYDSSLCFPTTSYVRLNAQNAAANPCDNSNPDPDVWNSTAPTAAHFTVGNNAGVNASGGSYVAYLFAEVPGFSKFGSYTGK